MTVAKPEQFTKWAKSLDDVTETVACKNTPIEQASFKVKGKSFLFVQQKDGGVVVRLKLRESAASAAGFDGVEVGAGGWTTIRLGARSAPPKQTQNWIGESYALSIASRVEKKVAKRSLTKKKSTKKSLTKKKSTKKSLTKKKPTKKSLTKKKPTKKSLTKKKPTKKSLTKKKPTKKSLTKKKPTKKSLTKSGPTKKSLAKKKPKRRA